MTEINNMGMSGIRRVEVSKPECAQTYRGMSKGNGPQKDSTESGLRKDKKKSVNSCVHENQGRREFQTVITNVRYVLAYFVKLCTDKRISI